MKLNIGIIGAAEMGSLLAKKIVDLGHNVTIANSRGAETLKKLADEIGAKAVSINEITKNQEVIIISIPLKNIPDLPKHIFEKLPDDVVVIETCNYYPTLRDGDIPKLQQSGIDSLWVQEQLGVTITKVFNSILATSLRDFGKKKGENNRIALAVSGDNSKSKKLVFKLVDELGFDTYDIGTIAQSWKQQPGSTIYCRDIPLDELKKRADAMGNEWSEMRESILAKRKADEILMRENYAEYLKKLKQ